MHTVESTESAIRPCALAAQLLQFYVILALACPPNAAPADTALEVYIGYELPDDNNDVRMAAHTLEAKCLRAKINRDEVCAASETKEQCTTDSIIAFRQCILGTAARFWAAVCRRQRCDTVHSLFPLTDEETVGHNFNNVLADTKPTKYGKTGLYVDVGEGCVFRRTSDGARVYMGEERILCKLLENYLQAPKEEAMESAIRRGQKDIVTSLLSRGISPNRRLRLGDTPLQVAVRNCENGIVEELLGRGATINVRGEGTVGQDLVHRAASNGQVEALKLLIKAGADVAAPDEKGGTTLHTAAQREHYEVVRALLSLGVSPRVADHDGNTPLHEASPTRAAIADCFPAEGRNVPSDPSEVIKLLVAGGADVNARNGAGRTPLHEAVTGPLCDEAAIGTLIDLGGDVNARDEKGLTPLGQLLAGGRCGPLKETLQLLSVLVTRGAEVNVKDGGGTPLLQIAACRPYHPDGLLDSCSELGNPETVEELLKLGTRVNEVDERGDTALHLVVRSLGTFNKKELVMVLLKHGADAGLRNKRGMSAVEQANPAIEALLRSGTPAKGTAVRP